MSSKKRPRPELTTTQHLNMNVRRRQLQPLPDAKPNSPKSPSGILSLSTEMIARILYFLADADIRDKSRRPKNFLSLALTCKTMFSHVTRYVALSMRDTGVMHFDTYKIYQKQQQQLLFNAASIAIKQLLKPPTRKFTGYVTRRSRSHSSTTAHTIFSNSEKHCPGNLCHFQNPPLKGSSHTATCRVMLSWVAIAACSDIFTDMKWDARNLYGECLPYCIIRFSSFVKCPFVNVSFGAFYRNTLSKANVFYKRFLQSCASTLQTLQIEIRNDVLVSALCDTKLPHLKSLSISFGLDFDTTPPQYHRNVVVQILKSLLTHNSRLTKLELPGRCFQPQNCWDEQVFDLTDLAPDVKELKITRLARNGEFDNFLKRCANVQILEFDLSSVHLTNLENARRQGALPNLTSIRVQRTREVGFPMIKQENWHRAQTIYLIEEFTTVFSLREHKPVPLDIFTLIPKLSLSIKISHIPDICNLLLNSSSLRSLELNIELTGCYLDSWSIAEKKLYYSSALTDALVMHRASLERLTIKNFCTTTTDGIKILRLMGHRAKEFCIPLTDQTVVDGELVRREISVKNVLRILNTVAEHCPNIEKLRLFPEKTLCEWSDTEFEQVEKELIRTTSAMKHLDPKSFLQNVKLTMISELQDVFIPC